MQVNTRSQNTEIFSLHMMIIWVIFYLNQGYSFKSNMYEKNIFGL